MFKLALSAGHGINTAGKRCLKALDPNETREWVLNSRICDYIQRLLSSYPDIYIERMDDTTGATNIALNTRTSHANKMKADFYLSIHHNAGVAGGTGGGIEAYTYTSVGASTKAWQSDLYNSLINYTGLRGNRSNGLRQADLAECRDTAMDAVLLECGFMDSSTDVPIILTDGFAQNVAQACVDVILAHAGIAKKSNYNYRGYLDGADRFNITGWAWNGKDDTPCEVHIYIYRDDIALNRYTGIIANVYREDLKSNGIGNGSHGFIFPLDMFGQFGEGKFFVRAYVIGDNNPQLVNELTVSTVEYANQLRAEQQRAESAKRAEEAAAARVAEENAKKIADAKAKAEEEARISREAAEKIAAEKSEQTASAPNDITPEPKPDTTGIIQALKHLLQLILNWINK